MVDRISHAAQDWHMYTSPEISKQIFDVLRAAQLMEEADLDVTLVHTPFNFGYVTDYNYFEAGPDFLMEDGQLYYDAFAGVMRDCPQDSFMVCCTAEEGDVTWRDPWIKDRRFWGPRFMVTAGKQQTEVKPDPITTVVAALL
jgi:hypothetical protein